MISCTSYHKGSGMDVQEIFLFIIADADARRLQAGGATGNGTPLPVCDTGGCDLSLRRADGVQAVYPGQQDRIGALLSAAFGGRRLSGKASEGCKRCGV